jgi:hypothetical protein
LSQKINIKQAPYQAKNRGKNRASIGKAKYKNDSLLLISYLTIQERYSIQVWTPIKGGQKYED